MANIRDIPGLIDPAFIESPFIITGGGDVHVSGDGVVINAIPIGDGLYEIGGYIVNERGDILGTK